MDIRHELDLALVRLNALDVSGVGNVLALADAMRAIIQVRDSVNAEGKGDENANSEN